MMTTVPPILERAVTVQLDRLELDVRTFVVVEAILAQIVVRKINGMISFADDGC